MNDRGTYQYSRAVYHRLPPWIRPGRSVTAPGYPIPSYVEYAYYFYLFYDTMGGVLPVSIPMLGGGMLLLMAAFCLMRLRSFRTTVYAAIAFPLACAFSYLFLQLAVHNQPLMGEYVRPFVVWILLVIVTQSLCLREGFLHRFALVTFIIGLMTLPYFELEAHTPEVDRVTVDRSLTLADPNLLAAWFGFCAVYFITAGTEINRSVIRITCWLIAVGCLSIVGLTVSRGALFSVGVATIVALRHLLKRGFLPLLLLVTLSGAIYASGLFDRVVSSYTSRGMEETGRLLVWPLVIEHFLNSPLVGAGASDTGAYVWESDRGLITPHNPFLFLAVASGIIPLAFFVAYLWRAGRGAICSRNERRAVAPFLLPLFVYSFWIVQTTNFLFVLPLVVAPLSLVISRSVSPRMRRIVSRQTNAPTLYYPQKLGMRGPISPSKMVVQSRAKVEPGRKR